ncbi:putative leucine-rich repeat domain superfamily [Helianthus annuus]|nr:putative leucine-rich repeat domain superfamily [Helianthus annuus]
MNSRNWNHFQWDSNTSNISFFHKCPNLNKLSHPQQHLTSLQHLCFWHCPNMIDLPEGLLPSLLSLIISSGVIAQISKKDAVNQG